MPVTPSDCFSTIYSQCSGAMTWVGPWQRVTLWAAALQILGRLWQLPGASVENPAHGKGHEEKAWLAKARSGLEGPPFSSIYPKTKICLFYYFMTFTSSSDINRGLSPTTFLWKNQLRALANTSPGHERNISNQTPSVSILACLAGLSTLAATHVIICSLPTVRGTGSLKHIAFQRVKSY